MRFELTIGGMLSVHAKHAVFSALGAVDGLVSADVELGRAEVEFSSDAAGSPESREVALRNAVAAAGCDVVGVRLLPRTLPTL